MSEDNPECCICLGVIEKKDICNPYQCNHSYHSNCFTQLKDKTNNITCLLCMKPLVKTNLNTNFNHKFNNQLEGEREFDLNSYIKKWPYKTCLQNCHELHFETLGDWEWPVTEEDIKFIFRNMLIECSICNKYVIV